MKYQKLILFINILTVQPIYSMTPDNKAELIAAIDNNDQKAVEQFIQNHPNSANKSYNTGEGIGLIGGRRAPTLHSPLNYTIRKSQNKDFYHKFIPILLNKGADPLLKDERGNVPLIEAVRYLDLNNFKLIADKVTDNEIDTQNKEGYTALWHAASTNKLDIADYLIKRNANVNFVISEQPTPLNQSTPLIGAVKNLNYDVAKLLLENGAQQIIDHIANGFTALGQLGFKWMQELNLIGWEKEDIERSKTYDPLANLLLENGADPNATGQKNFAFAALAKNAPKTSSFYKFWDLYENKQTQSNQPAKEELLISLNKLSIELQALQMNIQYQ